MIGNRDAEQFARALKAPRRLTVLGRGGGITGRMVMLCGASGYVNSRTFLSSSTV